VTKAWSFPPRGGSALLLTLWCVAVLSVTILAVARMVQRDVDVEGLEARRFEARQLALTGIALGMNPRIERWDPLLRQKFPNGFELQVRTMSEAARLNINRLLKEPEQLTLRRLFDVWQIPPEDAGMIIDSLVDWIDPDDLRMPNGAERDDLLEQNRFSIPANRDFHSVAEMERVRGMDVVAAWKPDWQEFFTVHGGRRVDLQDAPIDTLQAVGEMPRDIAAQIAEVRLGADLEPDTRDDLRIEDVAGFFQQFGFVGPQADNAARRFGVRTEPTRIESSATVGGTTCRIVAVTNRAAGGEGGLISWEER
jgi:type II secretory pathway component PulK